MLLELNIVDSLLNNPYQIPFSIFTRSSHYWAVVFVFKIEGCQRIERTAVSKKIAPVTENFFAKCNDIK